MIAQGEIWWVDFPEPIGSSPGFRRPALVIQGDEFNRSRISTVIVIPLTSNLRWADSPGNLLISARSSGLSKDSVANVSLITSVDRIQLTERAGRISRRQLEAVLSGLDLVLGR